MCGYWEDDCPVRTDNADVLATVYARGNRALIALASWADAPVRVKLRIDWKALGLGRRDAVLRAPAIANFQRAASFSPGDAIPIEPRRGWMLVLERGPGPRRRGRAG